MLSRGAKRAIASVVPRLRRSEIRSLKGANNRHPAIRRFANNNRHPAIHRRINL